MRGMLCFSQEAELRYSSFDQENRLQLSDDFFANAVQKGYFMKDACAQGYYCIREKAGIPVVAVFFTKDISFEDAQRHIACLSEACIRTYHPNRILCDDARHYLHVWNANGYYSKGACLQKKIETWRLQLKDSIFDQEGYIIDQGAMREIPFGWFNTMDKGCGWIAAYNLLKMCGREQDMQVTAEEMARHILLGGVGGQELYTLWIYLKGKGLKCYLSLSIDASALACMANSRYGILLYSHSQGAHYTAYRNLEDGQMQFYNAVYGRENHYESAQDFLKNRELLPFASVIYVKK